MLLKSTEIVSKEGYDVTVAKISDYNGKLRLGAQISTVKTLSVCEIDGWNRIIGRGEGVTDLTISSIESDDLGNIYVAGMAYVTDRAYDIVIQKFSKDGAHLWATTFGGTQYDYIVELHISDSDLQVAGHSYSPSYGAVDLVYLKLSVETGAILWQRRSGSSISDQCGGLTKDNLGGFYIAGHQRNTNIVPSLANGILLKYGSTGTALWSRSVTKSSQTLFLRDVEAHQDSIYTTGNYAPSNSVKGSTAILLKYNTAGALLWQRDLAFGAGASGKNVKTDTNGDIYISGDMRDTSYSDGNLSGIYVAKLNAQGAALWGVAIFSKTGIALSVFDMVLSEDKIYLTSTAGKNAYLIELQNSEGTVDNNELFAEYSLTFGNISGSVVNNVSTMSHTSGGLTVHPTIHPIEDRTVISLIEHIKNGLIHLLRTAGFLGGG